MRRALALVLATACVGDAPESRAPVHPPEPASLLREGARPTTALRADLDGDGTQEVILASVGPEEAAHGFAAPHLEVFAEHDGRWWKVLDASGAAPPGPGAPERMLREDEVLVQHVEVVEAADLTADGSAELIAGIATAGATRGPVELWILSMPGDERFRTEYYASTERGGGVELIGDRVRFSFPVYRPNDPGCCPSRAEEQVIGLDPETGRIAVLERERRKIGP